MAGSPDSVHAALLLMTGRIRANPLRDMPRDRAAPPRGERHTLDRWAEPTCFQQHILLQSPRVLSQFRCVDHARIRSAFAFSTFDSPLLPFRGPGRERERERDGGRGPSERYVQAEQAENARAAEYESLRRSHERERGHDRDRDRDRDRGRERERERGREREWERSGVHDRRREEPRDRDEGRGRREDDHLARVSTETPRSVPETVEDEQYKGHGGCTQISARAIDPALQLQRTQVTLLHS